MRTQHPLRRFVLVLIALFATLAVLPAHAAWQPGGVRVSPVQPLPDGASWQRWDLYGLVSDDAGGILALWTHEVTYGYPLDEIRYEMVVQRLDASGNIPAPWTSAGTTIRTWISWKAVGNIDVVNFVSNGAGGGVASLLTHEEYFGSTLHYVQICGIPSTGGVTWVPDYSGTDFRGANYRVGAMVHGQPYTDSDGQGGIILMGVRPRTNPAVEPLYTSRILPTGAQPWGVPDESIYLIGPILAYSNALQGERTMIADGAGGAYYAWGEIRGSADGDLFLQRLDANGAVVPGWPAGGLRVCGAASFPQEVKLARRDGGGVIALWTDRRDGQDHLYATMVDGAGNLAPGIPADGCRLPSSHTTDWIVRLIGDGQGGAYVARGTRDDFTARWLHLQRFDATLSPANGWPADGLVLSTLYHESNDLDMMADGTGGLFLAFGVPGSRPGSSQLVGQHLAGDGAPAPGWSPSGYVLDPGDPGGYWPRIQRSSFGAIVAWSSYTHDGGGIFAQGLVPDGPVAVQVSLVSADVAPGEAVLRWNVTGAAALSASVERRSEESGWSPLSTVNADAQGNVRYVDRSVDAGRHAYRLSWMEDGTARTSSEVWVDVPGPWKLALSAPRPNPGTGPAVFSMTLPTRAPGTIELLDLQGRRVAHRDLGTFQAGVHTVTIDEAATLAPGVYLARLSHGGESRTVRITRIR